jgi:short-subunit dehydrogenase
MACGWWSFVREMVPQFGGPWFWNRGSRFVLLGLRSLVLGLLQKGAWVELRDRVVVITGASSGFGELIARRAALQGARLALVARSAEKLERLASELGGPSRALVVPTDVTSDGAVATMGQRILEHYGRVDVLLNNAGFGVLDQLVDAKLADLQGMVDVNLYGVLRCTNAFLPHMLARRAGQIVNMASMAGMMANPNMGFYTTTKHALVGLSRSLMIELMGTGVHCALICPGVAQTGFQARAGREKFSRISRLSSCTPEQVANATLRAMRRRTHGEVYVPWYNRLFALVGYPIPGLTRFVIRSVG